MRNMVKRANLEQANPSGKFGTEIVFSRNMSYFYPEDYPAEIVRLVRELGIKMSSLAKSDSEQFKKRLPMLEGQSVS